MMLFCVLCLVGATQVTARAENVVASAKTVTNAGLVSNKKGTRYRYENGKYAKNEWLKIDGKVYRFQANGYSATGWILYDGKKYYANSAGRLYVGKWVHKGKSYYYMLDDGSLATNRTIGWKKKYYFVNSDGVRVTASWVTKSGSRYSIGKHSGRCYYFDKDGVRLQNTWLKYKKKYYYFGKSGIMQTSKWIEDYYVGPDGARMTDCTVDGYYLDSTGKKETKNIMVGDSRTLGMKLSTGTKQTTFIAEVSMGYSWLVSTAGVELKRLLNSDPKTKVVLALGVNDLDNVDQYIAYYRGLIAQYPKTQFYVLSVNPVNEKLAAQKGYTVRNKEIVKFNKKLYKAFGLAIFINGYRYMEKKGFNSVDGVHYTGEEYRDLYDYITEKIK